MSADLDELDVEAKALARFRQLDDIEQLVLLQGLRALHRDVFTVEQFSTWVRSRFDRHRAGEALTVADIAIPGLHPSGRITSCETL